MIVITYHHSNHHGFRSHLHTRKTKIVCDRQPKMRVAIFMFTGIYCIWQVTSNGGPVAAVAKKKFPDQVDVEAETSRRDKEFLFPPPLVSPYGGTLKLVMGIAVPISMSGGKVLVFVQNFQFQFPIPQNATFFTNYFGDSDHRMLRRPRNIMRRTNKIRSIFYRSLELVFERWGGNGRECMMRTICEAAETPLGDEGLVGQLLDVMLTPDFGKGTGFDIFDDDDYLQAAKAGRSGEDCSLTYPSCLEGRGLLDRITRLDYV